MRIFSATTGTTNYIYIYDGTTPRCLTRSPHTLTLVPHLHDRVDVQKSPLEDIIITALVVPLLLPLPIGGEVDVTPPGPECHVSVHVASLPLLVTRAYDMLAL